MADVKLRGLTELDRAIKNLATKDARRVVRKGLTAARRAAVTAARSGSPSERLKKTIRGGSTSLFRSSRGNIRLKNNSVGNLGFTAVGVPGPYRVAPSQNQRSWFVAYSLEKGNPGNSSRSSRRGRYKRRQVASPFMVDAVEDASSEIVSAFESAARSELGL